MVWVSGKNNQLKEQMIKALDAAQEERYEAFVRSRYDYAFQLLSRAGYIDPSTARTTKNLKVINF